MKLTSSWPPARVEGGSEEHFKTPLRAQQAQQAQQAHRDHQEVNSKKLVLEQHSITLGLLTPPGKHAEVCFGATLHHFLLICCDHRNMPKSALGLFW